MSLHKRRFMKKISNSINLFVILFIITLSLFISTFSKVSYACDDVSGTTTISSDCSSAFSITGSNADITLSATASSSSMRLTNSGTNSSLTITSSGSLISTNGGIVIDGTVSGKSFDLISNAGTISATYFTIRNQKTITTLTNTGTITATEGNAAVLNQSSATITTFTNSGTISAPSGSGINNTATITTLTNTGTITSSGTDISNFAGTMVTLNNSQGKNGDDPLRLERFSTNYNIIINSTSDYGQLLLTNVENGTSTNFGIHSSSTLACETYTNVIDDVASGEIGSGKTGTFGDYSWTLSETSSGSETWNLTITGSASTCNTYTSPFLDSDSLAIIDGQINSIFNNTINTVQTIHSRMGYIRMKDKNLSKQNIQLAYNGNDQEFWDEQEEFWQDVDPEGFYNRRGDHYHSQKKFKEEQEYWKRQYEEAKREYEKAYEELMGHLDKKDVLNGGLGKGEIGVITAPTGVGKSHWLVAMGAAALQRGKNVIHYTFELSETIVGTRYDSNLCSINSTDVFDKKEEILNFYEKESFGRLIIKEYPTGSASVVTLRNHIEKLMMKSIHCPMNNPMLANKLAHQGKPKKYSAIE